MTQTAYTAVSTKLSINLFGAFHLTIAGESVPNPRARASGWILALLILHRSREVDRHWLAATLWPEAETPSALFNLRRNLSELRKMLGTEACRLVSPNRHSLGFNLIGVDCDLINFESRRACKDTLALQEAVSIYRGELLEGCHEEWIFSERIVYEHAYLKALEDLAQNEIQSGNLHEAAQWLRRLTSREPLREDAQCKLMETLGLLNDFAGVERQYRELRHHLRNELNQEPAPSTLTLYHSLKAKAQLPAGINFNLSPTHKAASPFNNLPYPLTSFIGRCEEMNQICAAMQTARLVSLVGTGGVGKTRLALSVAQAEKENYSSGVCFTDLSSTKAGADVPQTVASTFNLHPNPGITMQDALRRHLQPLQLLLILDNAEHIVESCASLANDLLINCPNLTILCTSRQPLNASGEIVIPISPLPVPHENSPAQNSSAYLSRLRQFESVSLLLDRILSAAPAFQLTPANAPLIASICCCLDGVPLALELAAARFRSLSPEVIADRLDTKFRLLSSGSPALPRHRTLHATLDWSYDLLSESEQNLLRNLSVFRGGWTLEAAEAISLAGEENTVAILTALVDKSLVVYESRSGQGRYRLLEMTRQYARDRRKALDKGQEIRRKHRDYFSCALESHREDVAWCKMERDNLREALSFSLDDPDGAMPALTMCSALLKYWADTGNYTEGRVWLGRALDKDTDSKSNERMRALFTAAFLAMKQSDIALAESLALASLDLAQHRGEEEFQCAPLIVLGHTTADLVQCQEFIQRRVDLRRASGNSAGLADALTDLGVCLIRQGELESARPILEEGAAVAKNGGQFSIDYAKGARILLARVERDWDDARLRLEEFLEMNRRKNDPGGIAYNLRELGVVYMMQGDLESPAVLFAEAVQLMQSIGDPLGLIRCLEGYAQVAAARAEYTRAVILFEVSERQRVILNTPLPPVDRVDYESLPFMRAELGEENFAKSIDQARLLTFEQAVNFALNPCLLTTK